MKVAVIDLETTGLDPSQNQILEIAVVLWDTTDFQTPPEKLPSLRKIIDHQFIVGEPFALWMNNKLLYNLAKRIDQDSMINESEIEDTLITFFAANGYGGRIIAAGKNVAGFDLQFLKPHLTVLEFKHRTLDPAMMFVRSDDETPPDLETCLQRAGIDKEVAHTALEDCWDTIRVLRVGFLQWEKFPPHVR